MPCQVDEFVSHVEETTTYPGFRRCGLSRGSPTFRCPIIQGCETCLATLQDCPTGVIRVDGGCQHVYSLAYQGVVESKSFRSLARDSTVVPAD